MMSLVEERGRLDLADMIATGFHEPKKLMRFENALQAKINVTVPQSDEDVLRIARELFESTIAPTNPPS